MYILALFQYYIKDYKSVFITLEKLLYKIKDKKHIFEITYNNLKLL